MKKFFKYRIIKIKNILNKLSYQNFCYKIKQIIKLFSIKTVLNAKKV